MREISKRAPAIAAVVLLLGMTGSVLVASLRLNDGHLVYALDDPYIHMAMARNLALHGVWGITPYGFASTSSSPLWLLLLAGIYRLFGVSEIAPFILCLLSAIALVLVADAIGRRFIRGATGRFLLLLALLISFPLPTAIFYGLEHILHATLALLFMYGAARYLSDPSDAAPAGGARWGRRLLLLAPILTATRYEGALMIAVVGLLMLLRRRVVMAVVVGLCGALPLVAYGIFSRSQGWLFLPNSILMKGNIPEAGLLRGLARFVIDGAYTQIVHNPSIALALLLPGAALVAELRRGGSRWRPAPLMLVIALLTILLHCQFAGIGGFHRYEAYLMALAVMSLAPVVPGYAAGLRAALRGRRDRAIVLAVVALIALLPFIHRGLKATVTPTATGNIYRQQYRMGRFVARYYRDQPVAVNDLGAVTFLGEPRTLDVYGLGSLETLLLKRAGNYTPQTLAALCREKGARVGILYESWLIRDAGSVPSGWTPIGRWTISDNIVCGDVTVTFYALDPAERQPLAEHLREFEGDGG
jgi:hypothetical protein